MSWFGAWDMGKSVLPMRLSKDQLARIEAGSARRAAEPVEVVVSGVGLKPSQRAALVEAERLAAGGLSERRKAAALVRRVEAQLRAAREGLAVEDGIADTLARAEGRGEAFEVETVDVGTFRRDDHGGLVRVKGQPVLDVQTVRRARRADGLASLHRGGWITDDERRIADECRALVEAARPLLRGSVTESRIGSAWFDKEAAMAAAMDRGAANLLLTKILELMSVEERDVFLAIVVQRESLWLRASGGRRGEANRAALSAALATAGAAIEAARKKRLACPAG